MPRFAANISMLFTEHPLIERFAAAKAAGFSAVEILDPYVLPAEQIGEELARHDLGLALINTPAGDWAAGERGMAALAGQCARFEAQMAQALDYAAMLTPGIVHVMAGIDDGSGHEATFIDNLHQITGAAPQQRFSIEPINRRDMPGYMLHHPDQALSILQAVGAPNLALQLDLYHAQIIAGDLTRRIEAMAPYLGHVQIAGVPHRHEPDQGELNLSYLMGLLDELGYDGWVGAEYHPAGRSEDGLAWLRALQTQQEPSP